MKIKLKILTPVHIGSGEEISPIEYFIDQNKFIRLDMDSLFRDEEFKQHVDNFVKESSAGNRYIGKIVDSQLLRKHPLYSLDIHQTAQEFLRTHQICIKAHIKSAGRVYIPGSSLKGAILSAIIYKIAKKNNIKNLTEYEKLLSEVLNEISCSKLGRFSHWLDVSDSDFMSPEKALEISFVKLIGTKKRSLPVLLETLKPGIIFTTELKTSVDSYYKFGKLTEKEILEAVKEFYQKVLEKEKKWKISQINQKLPDVNNNEVILRLGQGCSVLSTSLLILAEELKVSNYSIKRKKLSPIKIGEYPRTKKIIADDNFSMGWVRIIAE